MTPSSPGGRGPRPSGAGERLYRALLAVALPRSTGPRGREEMVEVFLDMRERARDAGTWARVLFWPRVLADLAWTAVAERAGGSVNGRDANEDGGDGMGRGRERSMGSGSAFGAAGLGQAARSVLRRPLRTAVTAVTLGLGVGAGTLVAVLARDVLLEPLPYEEGDALLRLRELDEERRPWWPSRVNFEEWRAAAPPAVAGIEGLSVPAPRPVLFRGRAVRADVVEASSGFFALASAGLARGRLPTGEEWGPGGEPVAVVSHDFWLEELGGGSLDGRTLLVGTELFPVVGVLEPGFGFLGDGGAWSRPDVWLPMERAPVTGGRQSHGIHVVARAGPGVGLERADAALDAMAARVAESHGEPTHAHSVLTTSLEADLLDAGRRPLGFLFLAAGGVLLVVGLNLAGTFLVDGVGRTRELRVRRALGAGRRHVVGQLLGEAAMSAVPGAVLGFGLAAGGLAHVRRLDPGALPRLDQVAVDPAVFLLAVAAAGLLALVSAALPGLLLTGRSATDRVAAVGRSGPGGSVRRLWNGMIVLQVALTFALLVGTSALTRSLASLLGADLGFRAEGVTTVLAVLPESRYGDPASRAAYFERALRELRGLPGVASASLVDVLPHVTQARISGTTNPDAESDDWMWAGVRLVDPAYFDVLGIPLVKGEVPPPGSGEQVLVDRSVEARLLAGEAVGGRVRSGMTGTAATVSGVVGAVREWGMENGAIGTIYVDFRAVPQWLGEAYLLVRGSDGRALPATALRRALQDLDPEVPLTVEPLDAAMGRTLGSRRLVLAVTAGFGLLGLLLAGVGIYGIVAYVARRRLRESGVRLALGARPVRVRARTLLQGVLPTAAGLVVGTGLALALLRIAGGRVPGLEAPGAAGFILSGTLLAAAAVVAGWVPARRVAKVDLTTVLREE